MSSAPKKVNISVSPAVKKPHVIVLDDDKNMLSLLGVVLGKKFEITAIDSAAALIIATEAHRPDLILLDLNMPNIDGFEALRLIKNHPATGSTPVVCISADDSFETRQRTRQAGAVGFLRKPFQKDRLVQDIEALLDSLNRCSTSSDGKRSVFTAHNEREKYRLIHNLFSSFDTSKERVVFLTWMAAGDFLNEDEAQLVDNENLIYLEIKPSLIIKFPYIQDVSPIFHEIFSLAPDSKLVTHLVFDELVNLVNSHDSERALAQIYTLTAFLKTLNVNASIYNTGSREAKVRSILEKIETVFTGGKD